MKEAGERAVAERPARQRRRRHPHRRPRQRGEPGGRGVGDADRQSPRRTSSGGAAGGRTATAAVPTSPTATVTMPSSGTTIRFASGATSEIWLKCQAVSGAVATTAQTVTACDSTNHRQPPPSRAARGGSGAPPPTPSHHAVTRGTPSTIASTATNENWNEMSAAAPGRTSRMPAAAADTGAEPFARPVEEEAGGDEDDHHLGAHGGDVAAGDGGVERERREASRPRRPSARWIVRTSRSLRASRRRINAYAAAATSPIDAGPDGGTWLTPARA